MARSGDYPNKQINNNPCDNCLNDIIERSRGRKVKVQVNVTGTGAISANIFKVTGSAVVIDAYGEIDLVTTLTNLTAAKFFLYDGTNSVDITANGADLSGFTAGSLILKTGDSTNAATAVDADQCRVTEADSSKKTHHPFIVTQKNGADTYIKMSCETTDNPVNFTVTFYVVYVPLNGGTITAV